MPLATASRHLTELYSIRRYACKYLPRSCTVFVVRSPPGPASLTYTPSSRCLTFQFFDPSTTLINAQQLVRDFNTVGAKDALDRGSDGLHEQVGLF